MPTSISSHHLLHFCSFFSTAFSPGAGVVGVKTLRYLFPRFYLICLVPDYQLRTPYEGCPETEAENLTYLILTSLIVPILFACYLAAQATKKKFKMAEEIESRRELVSNKEFEELQSLLYGKTTENSDSMKMEDGEAGL